MQVPKEGICDTIRTVDAVLDLIEFLTAKDELAIGSGAINCIDPVDEARANPVDQQAKGPLKIRKENDE